MIKMNFQVALEKTLTAILFYKNMKNHFKQETIKEKEHLTC